MLKTSSLCSKVTLLYIITKKKKPQVIKQKKKRKQVAMATVNKPKLNEDKVHKTKMPLKETMQAIILNIKQISDVCIAERMS